MGVLCAVGVLEGVLMELVEEVSLLPSPLLHFIRSLAGTYVVLYKTSGNVQVFCRLSVLVCV